VNNGLRILQRRRAVDLDLARQFLDVPVANVSDCMSRMTAGGARLRPMHAGGRMAGPALTIKTRPGDNLMIHKALQLAKPGDVIVVDGGGDLTNALVGEIMVGDAIKQGLAIASETIRGTTGLEVENMTAKVEDNRITHYKVTLHVAFRIERGK